MIVECNKLKEKNGDVSMADRESILLQLWY